MLGRHTRDTWVLDDVSNKTIVTNQDPIEVRRGPDEGVYIYGLFVDGARWATETSMLAEGTPKVLYEPLPVLHVTGVLASRHGLDLSYTYVCPVYKDFKRAPGSYIFDVHMPTQDTPNKWVLRGVALVASID